MSKLKELIESGFALTRAASILGISIEQAKEELHLNSYLLKEELFSEDKIPLIVSLYKDGVSAKQLGKKYHIDKRRVLKWAKDSGILRSISESIRVTTFNEHIFDVIDTKEKAYWLGFFYADAYNSDKSFHVTLAGKDHGHLLKLAKLISLPLDKVGYNEVVLNNKKHYTSNLVMHNKYVCEKMTELGCPRAKSFIIKYPEWLDSNLDNHFIRGMFDGDGCLTYRENQKEWKLGLVSTIECCKIIQEIILKNTSKNIEYESISKTGNNTYNLSTNGNEKIRTILDWLYKDSNKNCRLDRKYDKYIELCNQQDNRKIGRKNYFIYEEVRKQIINADGDFEKIAKQFQVHEVSVWRIKEKAGQLCIVKKPQKHIDYSEILNLYESGLTMQEVSDKLSISISCVGKIVKRNGKSRSRKDSKRIGMSNQQFGEL